MYISVKALAMQEGCSERQIYRNVCEMEATDMYPNAVKESGGLKIDPEQYNRFLCRRRRAKVDQKKNKTEKKSSRCETAQNTKEISDDE